MSPCLGYVFISTFKLPNPLLSVDVRLLVEGQAEVSEHSFIATLVRFIGY
jgi:hypothetical protein